MPSLHEQQNSSKHSRLRVVILTLIKLDSLLLRVQTNPPGGNINPTPSVAVAGNPNINTPVSINTLPSLGNSIQAGVGSLQLGSGSQYGGPPDLSLYPNTGSMVGPIHSTPRSFKTHTYNPNISVGSVPNQSFPRPVMKMKNQDWPVFSGLWPDWPRFYSKWVNIVEAQGYSGKNLAEQLLQCVKGEAYRRIQAVAVVDDSAYITMWNRLLKLYTDPGTLMGWVNKQLGDFKVVHQGNHEEIVYFANEVERIHSDLFQIDPSFPAKIQTTKVDELASLLPPLIEERWMHKYDELSPEAKNAPFTHFVGFCCSLRDVHDRYLPLYPKSKQKPKFSAFQDGDYDDSHDQSGRGPGKPPGGSSSNGGQRKDGPGSRGCWMTPGHTGHGTWKCADYKALGPEERRQKILSMRKCILCLESYTKGHKCSLSPGLINKICCKKTDCPSKVKHRWDVSCNSIGASCVPNEVQDATIGSIQGGSNMFVAIYHAQVPGRPYLTVFCDNGSNVSLIYEGTAQRYNYKQLGKRKLRIKTINGVKDRDSVIYEVPVITKDGIVVVPCFSTPDYISDDIPKLDLNALRVTFPKYKNVSRLQRPDGPVEVLFGVDCLGLVHPRHTVCRSGNLSILRGPLGDTVVGVQESVQLGSHFSIQEVKADSFYVCKEASLELDKFIFGEEVGIRTKGSCKSCSTCPRCVLLSHQEQQELELVRQCLHFNEAVPRWKTALPFVSPKEDLPDKYGSTLASL